MKKMKKSNNKIIFFALIITVCVLIAGIFILDYKNDDTTRDTSKTQANLMYEAEDTPLSYKTSNKTTEAFVNSEVIDGVANITIGAGFGETIGSTLKVGNVSQSVNGAEKVIHIFINQDFNDVYTKPYNPSIAVKIPKIEPGLFKVKVKIDKRTPNFSQKPITMDVIDTLYIEDSFSYSIR